jgi:hypothetical protein
MHCDALLVVIRVIGAIVVACPCKRTHARFRLAIPDEPT